MLCVAMGLMTAAGNTFVSAQEAETVQSEDMEAAESEAETAEAEEEANAPDFELTVDTYKIPVKNETETEITKTEYKKAGEKGTLLLTEKDGTIHTYEDVQAGEWKEAVMIDVFGFLYVRYQDENGEAQVLLEKAEEQKLETPVKVYATENVNVRKEAGRESESLMVLSVADECEVSASVPGWLKLKCGDTEGYAYYSYFTEDQEEAEAELARREAEAAAAAAAAEAAAAQEYEWSQQQVVVQPQEPQGVYEVSRVKYDDCDGSGHGYYEITYSDGSVTYEEY